MKTIWKFKLEPECTVKMPQGAEILSVREQGHNIYAWALVDDQAPSEDRHFIGVGTGHEVPEDEPLKFLGSAHLEDGALVFHVFEVLNREVAPD
jgi:hypothetical protein